MRDPIGEYDRSAQRYWYVDGLVEIAGGLVILLLSGVFLIGGMMEPGPTAELFLAVGQPFIVLTGALTARRLVGLIKERVTYPRTGYTISNRTPGRKGVRLLAMAIGIGAVAGIIFGIMKNVLQSSWVPGISGAVIALLLAYLGYDHGIRRFYIMALYTLILGLLVVTTGLADIYTTPLFFGGFGMGWVVSGAVTLRHYLQITKPAEKIER